MEDLVEAANRTDCDAVTQAAVVHAQFETIHPFGDGNGRLGRVLIGWTLARRLGVAVPPPVSVFIARDPGGYLSGLVRWRLGEAAPWVEWVADAVRRSAEFVAGGLEDVEALRTEWREQLGALRTDATAWRLLELLSMHLAVSGPMVEQWLGVSGPAARMAIRELADRGILVPLSLPASKPGRPQWWVAGGILDAMGWAG